MLRYVTNIDNYNFICHCSGGVEYFNEAIEIYTHFKNIKVTG